MRRSVVFAFAFLLGLLPQARSQDVISASSGLLHYFEGRVAVDDKAIEHKAAVFPSLKNGSVLRTEKGRAEVMLTPDVYLRLDENSALRMISNSLTDTRLELTEGSAILDNLNAAPGSPIALMHEGTAMRFPKPGIYRVDCEPGELQVFSGEAEVTHGKVSLTVDPTHLYYFALEMTINKYGDGAMDEFYDWAHNRSDALADQAQMASAEQDSADPDPNSIAGLLGSPTLPAPGARGPYSSVFGYPPYGGGSTYGSVISPLYLSALTPFPGFFATPGIVVLAPYRHHPAVGTKWPAGTVNVHPVSPVVTRWPATGRNTYTYVPGSSLSGSTLHPTVGSSYRPVGPLPVRPLGSLSARPSVVTAPHPAAPAVSHPGFSHPSAVGHR